MQSSGLIKLRRICFLQDWMKIVNVNVVGTLNVTSTIFPLLAARKKGHVVNMSSTMVGDQFSGGTITKGKIKQILLNSLIMHSELTPFQGVGAIENQAVYVASKHLMKGLSKSLRKEGLFDGVKV